jgi:hypothetical protein
MDTIFPIRGLSDHGRVELVQARLLGHETSGSPWLLSRSDTASDLVHRHQRANQRPLIPRSDRCGFAVLRVVRVGRVPGVVEVARVVLLGNGGVGVVDAQDRDGVLSAGAGVGDLLACGRSEQCRSEWARDGHGRDRAGGVGIGV